MLVWPSIRAIASEIAFATALRARSLAWLKLPPRRLPFGERARLSWSAMRSYSSSSAAARVEIVGRTRLVAVRGDVPEPVDQLLLRHGIEKRFVGLELGCHRLVAGRKRDQFLGVYRTRCGATLEEQRDVAKTTAVFNQNRLFPVRHLPVVTPQREGVLRLRRVGRLDGSHSGSGRIRLLRRAGVRDRRCWPRDGGRQPSPDGAAGKRARSRHQASGGRTGRSWRSWRLRFALAGLTRRLRRWGCGRYGDASRAGVGSVPGLRHSFPH